jgi:hypothetical protein
MKRASYREGVAWIARNDSAGEKQRLDPWVISNMISVALLADLFKLDYFKVAEDVVRFRKKERANETANSHSC